MRSNVQLASGIFCRADTEAGPAVLAHGGAWNITDSEWAAHRDGMSKALSTAERVLSRGGVAFDVAVEAVATIWKGMEHSVPVAEPY